MPAINRKSIVHILILVATAPVFFAMLLVLPYSHELDTDIIQVNDNAVLVLRLLLILLISLNICGVAYALGKKQSIKYLYFLILFVACYKMAYSFFL